MPSNESESSSALTHGHAHDVDRLAGMLAAQRRQRHQVDAMPRGSRAWQEASDKLDLLNARLFHLAGTGALPLEDVGAGLDADIDSVPEDDEDFRSAVIDSMQEAIAQGARDDLEQRAMGRIEASASAIESATELLERARSVLHEAYPAAVLDGVAENNGVIDIIARRDGEVA